MKQPELRSIQETRDALQSIGYSIDSIDQFVPLKSKDNPIVGQPNPRQRRVLLAALRVQHTWLKRRELKAVGEARTNFRADLTTTEELIATLQL